MEKNISAKKLLTVNKLYGKNAHMELKEYIKLRNISISQAARELGIDLAYCNLLTNKKRNAGREVAQKIKDWSKGAISLEEMIFNKN